MIGYRFTKEENNLIHKYFPYCGSNIPELLALGYKKSKIRDRAKAMGVKYIARSIGEKNRLLACSLGNINKANKDREPLERIFYFFFKGALGKSKQKKRYLVIEENIPFLVDYCIKLFHEQNGLCALCGLKLEIPDVSVGKKFFLKTSTISVDRIDSSKGYEIGNIQIVHKYLNNMKWAYDQDIFIKMCKAVAKTHTKRKTATAKS